ncbi:hypothetical protein POKO110462_22475 [Pontibacter korlensis]|uniref:DUF7674 domain-containing protein n=1 Tax=Pontibacter korlensis TaxID=400092 RepID=A0A0E3UWD2_9BACT|nr:hypothetical protein [Pontibacter korlensis]AKD03307.1 hypothetical protein PKOR_09455 [Pontibacter korlensis]
MLSEQESIEIMLKLFPEFKDKLEEHRDSWGDNKYEFGLEMAQFSSLAYDKIKSGTEEDIIKLADFAEQMLADGNEIVRWAVKYEYLENITNNDGERDFPIERFTKKLKPLSVEFCKELDKGWGTKTTGIY